MLTNNWPSWNSVLVLLWTYRTPKQNHIVVDQVKLLIEQATDEKELLNSEAIY